MKKSTSIPEEKFLKLTTTFKETDNAKTTMGSQKIQTFNSQFTAYEGKRKGSEIKNLANVVRASNASDAEHQVVLTINGAKATGAAAAATSLAALTNSKNYLVVLNYSTAPTDVLANAASGATKIVHSLPSAEYLFSPIA